MVAAGLLESDERGSYRMGPKAKPLGAHVESWRKGEARMRPWKAGWVGVALGSAPDRATRRASLRALTRLGMGEGRPGLWLRPDNLAEPFGATCDRLSALGLEADAEPLRCTELSARLERHLCTEGWPLRELTRGYERALSDLQRSQAQLDRMPREAALVQTFLVGGAAIRVLATDPLLPEKILPSTARAELTACMQRYDAIGHRLWSQAASRPELRLIAGGRKERGARRAR
jgi:phenylacetic acid degradation operon negative regulatory protein